MGETRERDESGEIYPKIDSRDGHRESEEDTSKSIECLQEPFVFMEWTTVKGGQTNILETVSVKIGCVLKGQEDIHLPAGKRSQRSTKPCRTVSY